MAAGPPPTDAPRVASKGRVHSCDAGLWKPLSPVHPHAGGAVPRSCHPHRTAPSGPVLVRSQSHRLHLPADVPGHRPAWDKRAPGCSCSRRQRATSTRRLPLNGLLGSPSVLSVLVVLGKPFSAPSPASPPQLPLTWPPRSHPLPARRTGQSFWNLLPRGLGACRPQCLPSARLSASRSPFSAGTAVMWSGPAPGSSPPADLCTRPVSARGHVLRPWPWSFSV